MPPDPSCAESNDAPVPGSAICGHVGGCNRTTPTPPGDPFETVRGFTPARACYVAPVADRSFSDPDIQHYLASRDVVVLAMLTPSGAPLAMPMWFVHDERELIMGTVDGSAKVRHLERDPRVSVVAEGGSRAALDGVVLAGEVRFLTGD